MVTTVYDAKTGEYSTVVDISVPPEYSPLPLAEVREKKLTELSTACNQAIEDGVDVPLSTGTSRFTLTQTDQGNINRMFNAILMGATEYIYHPNNEGDTGCRVYSASDIVAIYLAMEQMVTGQTTYHNQLKSYILSLTDPQEVQAVAYGQPLTGEYLERYNELISVAQEQQQLVLSKAVGSGS